MIRSVHVIAETSMNYMVGVGYDTVSCNSYTPAVGEDGIGFYYHSVRCRRCGKISELKIIG